MTQAEKAYAFRKLHEGPKPLLLPNPWDSGTARILAALGFEALATTSQGLAWSFGRLDGSVTRDEALQNARQLVLATNLPVSADLENGYGDHPDTVAETIALAAQTGLVGASIEDATGNPARPIYDFKRSVARIEAAVAAARALPFPFTLVARAENFLHGINDLDDTIRRLQAYEEAGADVLYAPLLPNADAIRRVCKAVSKPVNVLAAGPTIGLSVPALAALGARRISLGSGLTRAAFGAFVESAREIMQEGRFDRVASSLPTATIAEFFR